MQTRIRGRRRVEHVEGDVRFHHPLKGVVLMEARDCSHRWVVYHHTYSFCLLLRCAPVSVRWSYNHRIYAADPAHRIMAMQPGEFHADLERTPPADFIVVQITPSVMQQVARETGYGGALNLKHPHPASQDPGMLAVLTDFAQLRCDSLFSSGTCRCAINGEQHRANLVRLVSAFITSCVEDARELVLPDRGSAVVRKAREHINENFTSHFDGAKLAKYCGCSPFYLDHAFGAAMGASPAQYHQEVLVAKTADLLMQTPKGERTIEEIAASVGWPGAAYGREQARLICKRVRRTFGVTPDALRPRTAHV
jgi:AraC-like DNA-binding protein